VEVEVVNCSSKPPPEKVLKIWAREWFKEGREMDLSKLLRRWVAERTFAWISHSHRMSKDYERLCSTGEAFVYAAMTRLMVKRLARAQDSWTTSPNAIGASLKRLWVEAGDTARLLPRALKSRGPA
jgi:Transposase DDE domain